ncbi:hypothetical protein OG407_20935 [Streptomyces sp. NBC_01515]|uniref:hypothetical protein n=1 Tax=Streptomyces sp. NBC_01515 TaxID=2903890 RepID=UPI003868D1A8
MTDTRAAQIMATMRGGQQDEAADDSKVDPTTLVIQRQMRGEPRGYDGIHAANAQGEKEYQAALQKRTRELREQGVQYPEFAARTQLQRESRARKEAELRRTVHEHAAAVSRDLSQAEMWEERANQPVVSRREIQPGTSVNEVAQIQTRDRVSEKLMAQRYRAGN